MDQIVQTILLICFVEYNYTQTEERKFDEAITYDMVSHI